MPQFIPTAQNGKGLYSGSHNAEKVAVTSLGSYWLMDQHIYGDYNQWTEEQEIYIREEFDQFVNGVHSGEGITIDTARTYGVENNWATYQFFARDDIGAPEEVFIYLNDHGELVHFTENQIDEIAMYERGDPVPISGIEGHHMHPVHFYPDDTVLASDPNNILFATEIGHREFLHDGNSSNYTPEHYFDKNLTLEDKLEMTIAHHEASAIDPMLVMASTYGTSILVGAAAFTIIQLSIEAYRLRHSTLPSHEIQKGLVRKSFAYIALGGVIATSAVSTKMFIDSCFQLSSIDVVSEIIGPILGVMGGYLVARLTAAYIKYRYEQYKATTTHDTKAFLSHEWSQIKSEVPALVGIGVGSAVISGVAEFAIESGIESTIAGAIDALGGMGLATLGLTIFKGTQMKRRHDDKKAQQNRENWAANECMRVRSQALLDRANKVQT